MQDIWAGRRDLLDAALVRSLAAIEFSNGQLVREQVEASDAPEHQAAALACLAAAEAVGSKPDAALPGAVAMACLSQMGLVFTGLENSGGAASLSTAWGMPRSLNAGDAFFAAAQDSVLDAGDERTAEIRLQAVSILDRGTRALTEALLAMDAEDDVALTCQRALLPAALTLGGLLGGGDAAARDRLALLGHAWAALSPEALARQLASDPAGWLAT